MQNSGWAIQDWLSLVLLSVTTATFVAILFYVKSTNAMAKSTKAMAKATDDLAKAEERRQKEAIRPRLCLEVTEREGVSRKTWDPKNIGPGYAIPYKGFSINSKGEIEKAFDCGGVRWGRTIAPQEIFSHSPVDILVDDYQPRKLFYQDIYLDWYWTEFDRKQGHRFFGPFTEKPQELIDFEQNLER